jgi:PhnB protein
VSDLPRVAPMLSYEDVAGTADWLVQAFGFTEEERIEHEGEVVHVTLRHGSGAVMLGKPGDSYVNPRRLRELSPEAARMYDVPWVVDGVLVVVDDLDSHRERASAAGATMLSEIEESSVGRLYRAEDPEGHRWMFEQA